MGMSGDPQSSSPNDAVARCRAHGAVAVGAQCVCHLRRAAQVLRSSSSSTAETYALAAMWRCSEQLSAAIRTLCDPSSITDQCDGLSSQATDKLHDGATRRSDPACHGALLAC